MQVVTAGPPPELSRRLGLADAVVIGLGSMMGAGIFVVFGPAAEAAGTGMIVALLIAAVIAYLNAIASAQLAAQYPTSGGTYVFGRERLGPWWGFAAGWAFVIGKTASCAAMAMTFGEYAVPGPDWVQRLAAVGAVVALTSLNYRGVTRTVGLTRIIVALTLLALIVILVGIAAGSGGSTANLGGWDGLHNGGFYGTLQAAGLMFFAFAGYARIATMGEEVVDPQRNIPRAILVALGLIVVIYLTVGLAVLYAAGPDRIAGTAAPLTEALDAVDLESLTGVARVGASVAALGALLALIAGIGRTALAMGRHRDLPGWFASVHTTYRVPHHAEMALAVIVCALVLTVDLRGMIGFSSFGVLLYYAIANASAFTQDPAYRRWPRWLNLLGVAGCLVVAATLPPASILAGAAALVIGLIGRYVVISRRRVS